MNNSITNAVDIETANRLHQLPPTALLTRVEAAAYLRVSGALLEDWGARKVGVPFKKIGKLCRYQKAALDLYLNENTVETTPA